VLDIEQPFVYDFYRKDRNVKEIFKGYDGSKRAPNKFSKST